MFVAMVAVYFIAMIWIGVASTKKIKNAESFLVADRTGTVILITGSLLATIIGGSSTVGMAGKGFSWGLVGAWWLLVGIIGLAALCALFAKHIRALGLFTLPELLAKQYGSGVRLLASVVIVCAWVGVIGGQIAAAGKILITFMPGTLSTMMAAAAAVFVLYTVLGGQISIIRTDAVQSAIMMVGIGLCAILGLMKAGGTQGLAEVLPPDFFRFPVNSSFSWTMLIEWLVLIGTVYVVGPDIYSRLFSSKSPETAQRSVLLTALLLIPFAAAIVVIGMAARVLAPTLSPEEAFPYMIKASLPHGVDALVTASLLAAIMSSADTVLLTASTIASVDIINPFVQRIRGQPLSDRSTLHISRLAVLVFGLLSLALAVKHREVIGLLLYGYSVYAAGLGVPVILGFYRQKLRLNAPGAISAIIGGGGWVMFSKTSMYHSLATGMKLQVSPGVLGFFISLVVLFVGSRVASAFARRQPGRE